MAETSIGPRLQVTGEKEFKSAIASINNEFKMLGSEMKLAVSQFDKNDKSTQALTAQNKVLGKEIDSQKGKIALLTTQYDKQNSALVTLKDKLDVTKAAFGADSAEVAKAQKEYDKQTRTVITLQTQLNNATTGLNKMDRALADNNKSIALQDSNWTKMGKSLDSIGTKMKTIGEGIKGFGEKLSVGLTAPILGVAVAAGKLGMDFEAAMSKVKAISGATGEDFKKLNDQALQLGQDTAFSASQAADGMENLASAGFNVTEVMQAMPGMLDLAASGGLEVADASDIAASALRGFGLDAGKSGHVADVLAKAAADTNANVTDMGMALKYAASPAHALGMSLEEVSTAIGIMSNAGIKGEQAGTTLRGVLVSLASPSGPAADAIKAIGFNAFDATGKMLPFKDVIDRLNKSTKNLTQEKKADAIATIFGREAMSGMLVMMEAGPAKFDELTKSFKGSDGAAKAMAVTMQDNAKSSVEQMMGSLETAAIKIEQAVAPTITKFANKLQELANAFSNLSPGMQETLIKTALFVAAIGPVLVVTGALITAFGTISSFLGAASIAMGITSVATAGVGAAVGTTAATAGAAALLFNPVTLAIAAVGIAAVGVGIALNQKVIPAVDLFGGQVSKATEKAVTAYMDLDKKVGVSLLSFQANNTIITKAIAAEMVGTFTKMGSDIKVARDAQYVQDLANLTKFYTDQGTLDSTNAQTTLTKLKEANLYKNAEVDKFEKDIALIVATAAEQKRVLTQTEEDKILAIKGRMEFLAIQALTNSEAEQGAIYTRMRLQAKNMTTLQASEVIGNSAKQRDETVKLANDQYEKTVNTIARQRKEGVIVSDDQARNMIDAAERTRSQTVEKAGQMHRSVVDELGKMNTDVASKLNASDGSVKTHWQNLGSWFASHPIVTSIISGVSKGLGGGGFIPQVNMKASGDSNYQGGFTTLHEKGYELYNLPRGSQIYNHEASQDMVLKTAQEVAKGVLEANKGGGGLYVTIEKFINNGTQSVQAFAEELEFYRKQVATGRGGN